MKKTIQFCALFLFLLSSTLAGAFNINPTTENDALLDEASKSYHQLTNENYDNSVDDFLSLSPKSIKEKTGKKLNLKETLALKHAQKKIKKAMQNNSPSGEEPDKTLVLVLCFFIPPVAVYLCYGTEKPFVLNLILTLLCGLPGIIHAFVVCMKYFDGKG